MHMTLIFPRWPKLARQTEFHLPPHGPIVFAAAVPPEVDITFVDENREEIDFTAATDLVAVSVLLTCQLPRAFEIAARCRELGVPTVFGGIAVTLHADEVARHADAVFLGEAEGHFSTVLDDFRSGRLQKVYDFMHDQPDVARLQTPRRDLLNYSHYTYRGVRMLDLVHASRGCRFNCFPCCVGYLGGRQFRPRPVDQVVREMDAIPNNRLFLVDNSLAQDRKWTMDLFAAMRPLKKKWVSHPILDDDQVLDLAAAAGCWYVYQAVFDTSDVIRKRIRRLKDHGIGVEGTIILGTDEQDEDYIKRLIDFVMDIGIDMAEFTVMTPFPHSPVRAQLEREGRILSNNWLDYTGDKVVFRPARMTPDRLQTLYDYAWDTFYRDSGYQLRMAALFRNVISREIADGTLHRYDPGRRRPARSTPGSDA
ncbi:MAG: radical SAM protein [Lentisphaerae bacterium RIFOXYB12_FULL_65_16]|nr:MAG: radical SAM protein [Lentisphaerae bacterium RIFOXYA12_64_32]OGV90019.1 MAG: radical SAM protein [Lentisphaerae bacterium RIFOXYB12_FULL_65_16]